jgi:hypothetical protein
VYQAGEVEMMRKFRSMMLLYDDFDNTHDQIIQDLKMFYNAMARVCFGKVRIPESPMMMTVNAGFRTKNQPAQRRICQFMWETNRGMSSNPAVIQEWDELMASGDLSAVFPDLVKIGLFDGSLDKWALNDLSQWLIRQFELPEIGQRDALDRPQLDGGSLLHPADHPRRPRTPRHP